MRRHRFDPISAVSGTAFLVIGASAVIGDSSLSLLQGRRVWAMLLLLGGLSLLAATVRRPDSASSSVRSSPLVEPPGELLIDAPQAPPVLLTDAEAAIEELRAEAEREAERAARFAPPVAPDAEPSDGAEAQAEHDDE